MKQCKVDGAGVEGGELRFVKNHGGHRQQRIYKEGRHVIAVKLAQIVALDYLGANPSKLLVPGVSEKVTQALPFDHIFNPESSFPPPPATQNFGVGIRIMER